MYGNPSEALEDEFKEIPIESTESALPPDTQRSYTLEIVCLVLGLCYLINYFIGKEKNRKISHAWLYAIKPVFDAVFTSVGIPNQ
jgi:hypothetical protein